jgi:hypothetical protein
MIKNNSIHYNIAAQKGGPGFEHGPGSWKGAGQGIAQPCAKMAHVLQESLTELGRVMQATAPPPKAKL